MPLHPDKQPISFPGSKLEEGKGQEEGREVTRNNLRDIVQKHFGPGIEITDENFDEYCKKYVNWWISSQPSKQ